MLDGSEHREARALAVAEFERPVALGAGAGTGKTRALVARLATWLLGPGWDDAATRLLAAGTLSTFGEDQERSQRIAEKRRAAAEAEDGSAGTAGGAIGSRASTLAVDERLATPSRRSPSPRPIAMISGGKSASVQRESS